MKVLDYIDRQIAKFFEALYQKIYWLTGKDNLWLAWILGLVSTMLVMIGFAVFLFTSTMLSVQLNKFPTNWGETFFLSLALVIGINLFGFMHRRVLYVILRDAERNSSREIKAIDPEANIYRKVYEALRMWILLMWPLAITFLGYLINLRLKDPVIMLGLCGMAVAFFLGGTAMYLATIEEPPKGRLRIKALVKSLLSKLAPKKRLVPVPIPI